MVWNFLLSGLTIFVKPIFDFLNKRVEVGAQVQMSTNTQVGEVGRAGIAAVGQADQLNAQVRMSEGKYSPWVLTTISGFMLPFAWHTWQVVLDSSPWVPAVEWLWFVPVPWVQRHVVGSWHVAALPGMFETTEHAVINSLFIGAGAALATVATIRALKK